MLYEQYSYTTFEILKLVSITNTQTNRKSSLRKNRESHLNYEHHNSQIKLKLENSNSCEYLLTLRFFLLL